MQSNRLSSVSSLSSLSDCALESGLKDLCAQSRSITAQIIEYLREVDARRMYLKKGFSSLFAFCTQNLGMSEGEANTRISVARLVTRVPDLLKPLETGEVNLTTGFMLRNHLSKDNCGEMIAAVAGKSTRDVEKVIAAKFPQPDAPTMIRKLPKPSASERTIPMFAGGSAPAPTPTPAPAPVQPKPFQPTAEDRHKVQFTASSELREKIERALRLSSHRNRTGDLSVLIEEAMDLLLKTLESERLGKNKSARKPSARKPSTRSTPSTPTRTRKVTTARFSREVRREVFKRDGEQCAFVGESGVRCTEKRFLEIDHVHAKARGGNSTIENARVLCAAHNRHAAEQEFGREYVEKRVHLSRQR